MKGGSKVHIEYPPPALINWRLANCRHVKISILDYRDCRTIERPHLKKFVIPFYNHTWLEPEQAQLLVWRWFDPVFPDQVDAQFAVDIFNQKSV